MTHQIPADTARMAALVAFLLAMSILAGSAPRAVATTAMQEEQDRIDSPANGASVSGTVEIRGRATGPDISRFSYYRLLIGEGKHPPNMRPLGPPYDNPVESGVLATWNTDRFPSGEYTLVLQVYDVDYAMTSASVVVIVADKATPTPIPMVLPPMQPDSVTTTVDSPSQPPADVSAPPSGGDGLIPIDLPTPVEIPTSAPLPALTEPTGPDVPINPIPIDPNSPPPVRLDTPAQTDPAQLPFAPAPVYVTPIEFDP